MSEFTETIRNNFKQQHVKNGAWLDVDISTDQLAHDPYHDYKVTMGVSGKTTVNVRPNEDPQMIEDALLERITSEVYGDIRVRLDEFIRDRLMMVEATDELKAIVEMMR